MCDAACRVAIEVLQPETRRETEGDILVVIRFLGASEKAACNNFLGLHRLVSAR